MNRQAEERSTPTRPAARSSSSEKGFVEILAPLFRAAGTRVVLGAFGASLAAAIFETIGVASILPFMALVLDPALLDRYPALATAGGLLHPETVRNKLLVAGALTAGIVALGNVAAAANVVVQQRFGARVQTRLGSALFETYLQQPYAFHVHRDGPSLMKVVLTDVSTTVNGVVTQLLLGISKGLMAAGILILLFVHDAKLALIVGTVLGGAFFAMFLFERGRQHRLGVLHNGFAIERQRVAQEALGGVKELQALGRERYAIERFAVAARGAAYSQAASQTMSQIPRYVLETVAFGGILVLTLLLVAGDDRSARSVIPVLSLYGFAGYRFIPALQQIFLTGLSIRFSLPALRALSDDLLLVPHAASVDSPGPAPEFRFEEKLQFERVGFSYPGASADALRDVTLSIRPNESIGLVGRTGAGKTTLADLVLGLYEPTHGCITVDGLPLTGSAIRSWRRRVGYVPQHVFLGNASVAENIAFGLPRELIDWDAVYRAAAMAQADEFIDGLPYRFETIVGERGVKLSGGQRQRLGIARALYHNPRLLVFDEATSALDGLTEEAVMDAIRTLQGERTVILVAHRLRTVEACNRVVMLECGRIVAEGSYDELIRTSDDFRRMASRTRATSIQRETDGRGEPTAGASP